MRGTDLVHHEATKTISKQDAAYIRHFYEALKDIKTKSMQTAAYIRNCHASPKSCRSHLKPKVGKIQMTFINIIKKVCHLANTFKTYNPEEPYIKREHELIFTNEDINKLLQSDVSKYELSQFVNEVRFFDITYSNQKYSKLKDSHISGYNGLDMYNKNIDSGKISKQVTFTFIKTTNKNKSYLK